MRRRSSLVLISAAVGPIRGGGAAFYATRVVPAEVAQEVAHQHLGAVHIPHDVRDSIKAVLRDAGLRNRGSKQRLRSLVASLQQLPTQQARRALTAQRLLERKQQAAAAAAQQSQLQLLPPAAAAAMAAASGAGVPAELEGSVLRTTKSGRLKSQSLELVDRKMREAGLASMSEAELTAFCRFSPLRRPAAAAMGGAEGTAGEVQARVRDDAQAALAYALARLPGTYAALARVFTEIEGRLAGFEPRSMLAYGAGPGTAAWAAQEVWHGSLASISAVEPSAPAVALGRRLEVSRRFAHPAAPPVTWAPTLGALRQRRGRLKGRVNLVVAAHTLSGVDDQAAREQLVRRLWEVTSDVLVLVEPGTPLGFQVVAAARSQVLTTEARKRAKLLRQAPAAQAAAAGGAAGDAVLALDHNLTSKLQRSGAHVVAPCPHDGACPLAGSKSWCHFAQQYERPAWSVGEGLGLGGGDARSETYSYVVLRRGARPEAVPSVEISRAFDRPPAAAAQQLLITEHMISQRMAANLQGSTGAAAAADWGAAAGSAAAVPGRAAGGLSIGDDVFAAMGAVQAAAGSSTTPAAASAGSQAGWSDAAPTSTSTSGSSHGGSASAVSNSSGGSSGLFGADGDAAGGVSRVLMSDVMSDADLADPHTLELLRSMADELSAQLGEDPAAAAAAALQQAQAAALQLGEDPASAVAAALQQAQAAALQLGEAPESAAAAAPQQAEAEAGAEVDAGMGAESAGPAPEHAAGPADLRLGPYGAGLVQRLIALEDAGIDWSQGGEGLALESALAAQEAAAASPGSSSGRRSDATGDAGQARPQQQRTYQEQRQLAIQQLQRELPGASLAPAGSGDPLVQQGRGQQEGRLQDGAAWSSGGGRLQEGAAGSSGGGQPWRQLEPGDYWLAAESSTRWGRIIRSPRKRGGHVVLDVCVAAPAGAAALPAAAAAAGTAAASSGGAAGSCAAAAPEGGRLERHVVAKSDAGKWMGQAAYSLARSAEWGDLWPAFYGANPKVQVVGPAQQGAGAAGGGGAEGGRGSDDEDDQEPWYA